MKKAKIKNNHNKVTVLELLNGSEYPFLICTELNSYEYWCKIESRRCSLVYIGIDYVIIRSIDKTAQLTATYGWFNQQTDEEILRNLKRFIYGQERYRIKHLSNN